ncbi:TPA_asm: P [Cynara alphacytorhabdovirus 1]|nr:TPA_asm: P [Cynara alphacytorhabdovirus 1]
MAEESSFTDLSYGLAPSHAVLSDSHFDDNNGEDDNSYNKVPDAPVQNDEEAHDSDLVDYIGIKKALEEAGKDFGVPITQEMENYVIAMSSSYDPSGDALMWFMAAVAFQNNTKTIPNMISLIEDMRAEVKSLQGVNRSLTVTSGDIIKKMTGVKDDILTGFEGLRRSVLDKIVAIPTQIEAAVSSVNTEMTTKKDYGKGVEIQRKSLPLPVPKQKWIEKGSSSSTAEGVSAVQEKDNKLKIESLRTAKIKILKKAGVNTTMINALPPTVLDKLLTSSELMILVENWDGDEGGAIRDELEMRVLMIENDLFS